MVGYDANDASDACNPQNKLVATGDEEKVFLC
jgi:hypothetical protein